MLFSLKPCRGHNQYVARINTNILRQVALAHQVGDADRAFDGVAGNLADDFRAVAGGKIVETADRDHDVEQLEAGISGRINERLVGTEVEVLVEGQKTKSNSEPAWYGRTRGNKLVHFRGAAQAGELVTVRIERASPWSLVGTPAGAVAAV